MVDVWMYIHQNHKMDNFAFSKKLEMHLSFLEAMGIADDKGFNVDTILYSLLRKWQENRTINYHARENITLYNHRDISAYLDVYKEDGQMWLQFRIGYITPDKPMMFPKVDFSKFITLPHHNPLLQPSGQKVMMEQFFVNTCDDDRHRFGADFILDDFAGVAELLDYLFMNKFSQTKIKK